MRGWGFNRFGVLNLCIRRLPSFEYGQPLRFEGLASSAAAQESQYVPQEFQSHQNQLPQLVKLLPASKEHRRVWHFFLICGFAALRGV
jgi:hypothetical protein